MSNSIIPHLLSDSPPPIASNADEDFDDEFGDFTGPGDLSFDNDNISTPPTPKNSKPYFSDNYHAIGLNSTEQKYEVNEKSDGNSVINDITKQLPSRNYINILDHIENNSSKLEHNKVLETQQENNDNINDSVKVELENELKVDKANKIEINICDDTCSNLFKDTQNECKIKILNGCINDVDRDTDEPEELEKFSINYNILPSSNFANDHICNNIKSHIEDFPSVGSNATNNIESISINERIQQDLPERPNKDHNDNSVDEPPENTISVNNFEILNKEYDKDEEPRSSSTCFLNQDVNVKICLNAPEEPVLIENNEFNNSESFQKLKTNSGEHLDQNLEEIGISNVELENFPGTDDSEAHIAEAENGEIAFENSDDNSKYFDAVDDDFGDFSYFQSENNKLDKQIESKNCESCEDDQEFDSFRSSEKTSNDFLVSNSFGGGSNQKDEEFVIDHHERDKIDDDFDDFADYSTFNQVKQVSVDSDFDEFSDYSTFDAQKIENEVEASTESIKICKCPKDALKHAQCILENIFVATESNIEDYSSCEFTMNNSVFENLKDITETHALTYQWGKSSAQKNILKTLNIDKRNILYGPNWNSGVPIFAANLCSTPLQPIKSDIPPPLSPKKIPPVNESISADVPVTEFDWTSAGLTNPLDSLENVEKHLDMNEVLKIPLDESQSTQTSKFVPSENFQNLAEIQKDAMELSALEFDDYHMQNSKNIEENEEPKDDFSDFASCQPKYESETGWNNNTMQPLRESHIFNQSSAISIKSTDPEIPENSNFVKAVPQFDLTELESKNVNLATEPSDFDDFASFKTIPCIQSTQLDEVSSTSIVTEANSEVHSQNIHFSSDMIKTNKLDADLEFIEDQNRTEDEFTDFRSSSSSQSKQNFVSSPNFSEPLQPAVLQPTPVNIQPIIQWPEPGLDEEEVNRIVSGCLRSTSVNQKPNEINKKDSKKASRGAKDVKQKVSNNDDDEWSDFVSVKEPVKSRTSTPDLPLSVFNLGNIQPIKAPAPVVTPNGVIESPVKKPSIISTHRSNTNLLKTVQHSQHQPFITSKAYDSLYHNPKNKFDSNLHESSGQIRPTYNNSFEQQHIRDNTGKCLEKNAERRVVHGASYSEANNYGNFQRYSLGSPKNSVDDDEWGDFVSASNTSYINSTPNVLQSATHIITNPSHNMTPYSVKTTPQQYSLNSKCTVVRQERRNIPTISALPDLDFVTPKARNVKK